MNLKKKKKDLVLRIIFVSMDRAFSAYEPNHPCIGDWRVCVRIQLQAKNLSLILSNFMIKLHPY